MLQNDLNAKLMKIAANFNVNEMNERPKMGNGIWPCRFCLVCGWKSQLQFRSLEGDLS